MNRYAEVIEPRHKPDPVVIYQPVRYQDPGIDKQDGPRIRGEAEQRREELSAAVIDPRDRGNETDDVEPGGKPAPGAPPENCGPVVGSAGGWIRGGEFPHAQRYRQGEHADQRPAESHFRRPSPGKAMIVECDGAGEDRDD